MGADNAAEQVIARMIVSGRWRLDPARPWLRVDNAVRVGSVVPASREPEAPQ
jgi:hypothetical protein